MVKLKFNPRPGMPCFDGPGGHWNPAEVKNVPDDMAERLLGLHASPFSKWVDPPPEEKALDHAPNDKMMHGAPSVKATNEFEQVFTREEKIETVNEIPKSPVKTEADGVDLNQIGKPNIPQNLKAVEEARKKKRK